MLTRNRSTVLLFVAAAVLALTGCASTFGASGSVSISDDVRSKIVDIRAPFGDHRGVGVATGPNAIVTLDHVVADHEMLTFSRFSASTGSFISLVNAIELDLRPVARDAERDLATYETAESVPHFEVARPRTGPATMVTTRLGGVPEAFEVRVDAEGSSITGYSPRPGDSGSPILQDGRLVGLVRTAEGSFVSLLPSRDRPTPSPEQTPRPDEQHRIPGPVVVSSD